MICIQPGTIVNFELDKYQFRANRLPFTSSTTIKGMKYFHIDMEDMKDKIPYWHIVFDVEPVVVYECFDKWEITEVRLHAPDPNDDDDDDRTIFLMNDGRFRMSGSYELTEAGIYVKVTDFE